MLQGLGAGLLLMCLGMAGGDAGAVAGRTAAAAVTSATDDAAPAHSAIRARMRIVIDTGTNRLTVYRNGRFLKRYRVALGKPDTPTPVGEWKVMNKYKNWGSGFGTRWMGLNVPWGIYGIHGTNKPGSIGQNTSNGCIRMFNRDVEELYEWVRIGTPVSILGNPLRYQRRLSEGNIGADVLLVQDRLRRLGYYHGPCNGRFNPATEQALKRFELTHGLPVDGVVSLHDYQALGLME